MTEFVDKTLNMLEIGQKARVIQVKGQGSSRKRLLDMGMVPGTVLSVTKKSSTGRPCGFQIERIQPLPQEAGSENGYC